MFPITISILNNNKQNIDKYELNHSVCVCCIGAKAKENKRCGYHLATGI